MILAWTGGEYSRSAWEYMVAERYRRSGVRAVTALETLSPESPADMGTALDRARALDIDGVLLVRHLDTETIERYHPPQTDYYYYRYYPPYPSYRYRPGHRPYPRYYRHPGRYPYRRYPPSPFFFYEREVVVTPGYTSYHQRVRVESGFYLARSGEQVWSMTTETIDPVSENGLVGDISRATFRSLVGLGLLRRSR
ncbi:MAG: hypothetical protein Kow0089_02790 [Desulfobulbaceae bacterium]